MYFPGNAFPLFSFPIRRETHHHHHHSQTTTIVHLCLLGPAKVPPSVVVRAKEENDYHDDDDDDEGWTEDEKESQANPSGFLVIKNVSKPSQLLVRDWSLSTLLLFKHKGYVAVYQVSVPSNATSDSILLLFTQRRYLSSRVE